MSRWLLILLMLSLTASRVGAATPQQYDRALEQVEAALISQKQALEAQEVSAGQAPSLAAQQALGPIHSVGVPGHAPVLVDTSQLVAAIRTAELAKDPDQKAEALGNLSRQISLLRQAVVQTPKAVDTAAVTASARSVLARLEFASDPPPPPSLADKISAWLDRLFKRPNAPTPNAPNVNPNIILGILIAIAVGAFAVLVAVLVQAIGRREARARPLALDEEEAVLVEARDNESLLALAEQQAKAGDYRRAFRLVYLASLVALDSNGVVRFDRSKTNWEYLRALRASGRQDVYAALTPMTREFDQVWYGFAPTNVSQYAHALVQYHALLAAPVEAAVS
ncbi:MAG: DUF4129 domain-containing protein [Janthinobacterium lividum]